MVAKIRPNWDWNASSLAKLSALVFAKIRPNWDWNSVGKRPYTVPFMLK